MKNQTITLLLILLFASILYSQNNSLNFDGTDDNVEIVSNAEFTPNQFTIEAWVKSNAGGTNQPIFGKYNSSIGEISYLLRFKSDNTLRFGVYQNFTTIRVVDTNNAVLVPNSWQHVAATFDLSSQDIKIYVGGVEETTTLLGGNITSIYNGTQPIHISKVTNSDGNSFFFNGKIDEVRFWNTERTQGEISSNKDTELIGNESGLVAYYKMDENNSSCDVEDCNSNENHGTRNGFGGSNNLPQYSTDVPSLTNVACGASTSCSILPVELIEFREQVIKSQIQLTWKTASELNNAGFEIQKSPSGKNWQIIDFVAGRGTTAKISTYEYQDTNPFPGLNYYRLKQIDYDGAFEYSKVIAVNYHISGENIHLFPNPSSGLVNIQLNNPSKQSMKIQISDNLGRPVWESEWIAGESNWKKEIAIESNGTYFIASQIGDEVYYERVIILDSK